MGPKYRKKRKLAEVGSEISASKRRIVSQSSQVSDLMLAASHLRLNSSLDSSYNLDDLPSSASLFTKRAVEALKMSFKPAKKIIDVIPNIDISKVKNFPEVYYLNKIDRDFLRKPDFSIEKLKKQKKNPIKDKRVLSFISKLYRAVEYSDLKIGMRETTTDSLVDDLLRIVDLNDWPLVIRNHPSFNIYIKNNAYVTIPKFTVMNEDKDIALIQSMHLQNVGPPSNFGEVQIAAKILACACQNIRSLDYDVHIQKDQEDQYIDQTIFAIRVISTYVTFYKAEIPSKYLEKLDEGLPQEQKIEILRWPNRNGAKTGYNLAQPNGRQNVLISLVKIREWNLRNLRNKWRKRRRKRRRSKQKNSEK
ncbi:hypothetical protein RhiirA4_451047 [Rhizophagus irregularis]|uniref:Uncharacterized protein n=1 Tax=Rhizophagus irregularis TaxID=588596 RepID=A0A2I1FUS7_9GLOM|nr:hypothetical protein RhiirA4_451047 [Rhizophagus irregularis]